MGLGLGVVARAPLWVVIACPVDVGVVEVEGYPLLLAFIGELFQDVASEGGCVHDVVVALCGVEH